jgi:thymidylate synthase
MLKTLVQKAYDHEEEQYLDLIRSLLEEGSLEKGRNGDTICNIGSAMYFSLENQRIPILTTKKVAMKTCLKELLWFIRGKTNNQLLKEQNVHIWDLNGTKEFLESRGLPYEADDLGPVYGHQWRHFNASYSTCHENYGNCGVDQLQKVLDDLKNPETRSSRRHVISAWNPCQIDKMALPPCHVLFQFHVTRGNKLSCTLYQRSGDVGLGVPFNIMSYAAFTILVANHCDLEPHEFIYYLGNTHIYADHKEALEEQITRSPHAFPTMTMKTKRDNINDYELDDFEIHDYVYHAPIKMKMSQ